jgi:hypothetical protein
VAITGTVYLSIAGSPLETCGNCPIRYVGIAGIFPATSRTNGSYSISLPPGLYEVQYGCPSPGGGTLWVAIDSVEIAAVATDVINIVSEGCL